ncbi:glycoside hydrolase superfamily [Boletus edulis]|nr:glycoside hydrolase superfamily [Boletus edulis]
MKYFTAFALALAVARATPVKRANSQGIDISAHQADIDWMAVENSGVEFVYIKATEGTTYKSSAFDSQYTGAKNAGLIRGVYHLALPDYTSTGALQAEFFVTRGGGWSADGITLPGGLTLTVPTCAMECRLTIWSRGSRISPTPKAIERAVIYTTTEWWETCTENSVAFGTNNPLWISRYNSVIGDLPVGWNYATFWQYTDQGKFGDADVFSGQHTSLEKYVFLFEACMALGFTGIRSKTGLLGAIEVRNCRHPYLNVGQLSTEGLEIRNTVHCNLHFHLHNSQINQTVAVLATV